jgi:hypothetical protein
MTESDGVSELRINDAALKNMSSEQLSAIKGLVCNKHKVHITLSNPFDLPEGYLAFRSEHVPSGQAIYGGIAPDGSVST